MVTETCSYCVQTGMYETPHPATPNKHNPQLLDNGTRRTCDDPLCPEWRNHLGIIAQHAHGF